MPELLIRGAGPAGAVLALRARAKGWSVTLADPRVEESGHLPVWPATYGALEPELPEWALEFFDDPVAMKVRTCVENDAAFAYRMLNTGTLRSAVETSGARIIPATEHNPEDAHFRCVADCTGAPVHDSVVWQVAVGYVIPFSFFDATRGAPEPVFMDWSDSTGSQPSFLYIQHVSDGVLFEETILATHSEPKEVLPILEQRLWRRLNAKYPDLQLPQLGQEWPRSQTFSRRELVAIPMGTRRSAFTRVTAEHPRRVCFGAAGGLIHPATGYSIGGSFANADRVLEGLAASDGHVASSAWGRADRLNAELARALRRLGAELITLADGETLRSFFDAFFRLSRERQLAYLTGHDGREVARTMWALRAYTGFCHPFLLPLWKTPRHVLRAVKNK
ncbi:lycopene cyclase family protein [Corynebacterium urogenitale]